MTTFGYTLMCEQQGPRELVRQAALAEEAGFDFAVISDHYHPWLEEQGESPYAWSVLGAVAERTERMNLMTMVTCPIVRYHPAVVAQKAATVQLLSEGRFALGLGAGENLNEHVVGMGWPPAQERHRMLAEAIEIIRELWKGRFVTHEGDYFNVHDARVYSLPQQLPPIFVAAGGTEAAALAAASGDGLIATEPLGELVQSSAEPAVRAPPGPRSPSAGPRTSGGDSRQRIATSALRCRAGRSRRSCPTLSTSRRRAGPCGSKTWPSWSRTALTPSGTSRRSTSFSTPGSRTWPSCRRVPTRRASSASGNGSWRRL